MVRGDEPMEREKRTFNWRDSVESEVFLAAVDAGHVSC